MIRGIACVSTLCISAILFLPSPEALTHTDDKRALLELFRSTNGPTRPQDKGWRLKGAKCVIEKSGEQNCTVAEGWGDDSDPCDDAWFGVVNFVKREGFKVGCTGNAGDPDRRVTGIYLKNNVLRGELPESLGDLVELRELLLPSNGLRGTLPKSVGKLTKLESLWLHNNAISGDPAACCVLHVACSCCFRCRPHSSRDHRASQIEALDIGSERILGAGTRGLRESHARRRRDVARREQAPLPPTADEPTYVVRTR